MKKLLAVLLLLSNPAVADMGRPSPVGYVGFDRLEVSELDEADQFGWELDAWWGTGLHKLWLKSEGERTEGFTEGGEIQLLYSRGVAPYWDVQLGVKTELGPHPHRGGLVVGVQGLAPGFVETEAALLLEDQGRSTLIASLEREFLLTRRLWLVPELEFELNDREDESNRTGSGLSAAEASLRIGYRLHRKFQPYFGIMATRRFGETARFARADGEPGDEVRFLIGVKTWF